MFVSGTFYTIRLKNRKSPVSLTISANLHVVFRGRSSGSGYGKGGGELKKIIIILIVSGSSNYCGDRGYVTLI